MRRKLSKFAFVATLGLALAFIFSCSSSDDDSNSPKIVYGPSVNYGDETYETVVIGTQTWFKRNLNYGSRYCYKYLSINCNQYGGLYDWATAMALSANCNSSSCSFQIKAKHQGICPAGWHIPSAEEWATLIDFAGDNAGTKLKAISGWKNNGNGQDTYGFSALPGGAGIPFGSSIASGDFVYEGLAGYWWGSSETTAKNAYYLAMNYRGGQAHSTNGKDVVYSVRCIKD